VLKGGKRYIIKEGNGCSPSSLSLTYPRPADQGIQPRLQGLVVSNKKGKRSALTEKIKKDLYEILNTEPQKLGYDYNKWTGKLICRYLKENWNIDIAIRTAQNWKKLIQNQ
jgi:hypothetical protein